MKKVISASLMALSTLSACTATNVVGSGPTGPETLGCAGKGNSVRFAEANKFQYNATTDTISINNLPFDLAGTYVRYPSLDRNGFKAYLDNTVAPGAKTYVALYNATANVQAGVVATGNYLNYGYGGQMFGNAQTVSFPATGQAHYAGTYAGIRVYEGGGLGFSDGQVSMDVDFNDFDTIGAIDTYVSNRNAYDSSGALIGVLPDLSGTTTSFNGNRIKQTSMTELFPGGTTGSVGTLDGIFGGNSGTEIAGVIVLTGPDPLSPGQNTKETGAFLLLRQGYVP